MFKTIHKQIIKEILLIFLLAVICLDFILMMEKIVRLSRFLSGVGASFGDIVKITLLIQPELLILTVPMSSLLASLITYGRMNMDSELVVMKAVGMSMRQIALPAFLMGAIAFLITLGMTTYISPLSATMLRNLVNTTIKTRGPLALEEGVFHHTFRGLTILIGNKPTPEQLRDIFLYDTTNKSRPRLITAESGSILINKEGNPVFDIRNGHINITYKDIFTEIQFSRYVFSIDLGLHMLSEKRKEKPLPELLNAAERHVGEEQRKLYVEFHRRLTLSFINIFLVFLGPALSMYSGKSGRLSGFIFGIMTFGAYYSLLLYFENLVRSGTVPHIFSWTPLVLFGSFSVLLYRNEAKK